LAQLVPTQNTSSKKAADLEKDGEEKQKQASKFKNCPKIPARRKQRISKKTGKKSRSRPASFTTFKNRPKIPARRKQRISKKTGKKSRSRPASFTTFKNCPKITSSKKAADLEKDGEEKQKQASKLEMRAATYAAKSQKIQISASQGRAQLQMVTKAVYTAETEWARLGKILLALKKALRKMKLARMDRAIYKARKLYEACQARLKKIKDALKEALKDGKRLCAETKNLREKAARAMSSLDEAIRSIVEGDCDAEQKLKNLNSLVLFGINVLLSVDYNLKSMYTIVCMLKPPKV